MTPDTYWECALCGGRVSKQMGQHKNLRIRRPDGTGWDHTRCHPPDTKGGLSQARAAADRRYVPLLNR